MENIVTKIFLGHKKIEVNIEENLLERNVRNITLSFW